MSKAWPLQTQTRILMLHGFTQSGPLFHAKTRALEKSLKKSFPAGCTLIYPTGPHKVVPADIPNFLDSAGESHGEQESESKQRAAAAMAQRDTQGVYGWWVRRGAVEPFVYDGIEEGLDVVAKALTEDGPFDGIVGFSQGGAMAGMVASLLEPGRREVFDKLEAGHGGMKWPASFSGTEAHGCCHPPVKFAVSYSGFGSTPNPLYQAFYEPKIKTPMLHFIGQLDTVVDESKTLRLVEACEGGADGKGGMDGSRVVRHPGGHFLPASQKDCVNALVAFIRETLGTSGAAAEGKAHEDERAEDMEMPF